MAVEKLIRHVDTLTLLWSILDRFGPPPDGHAQCQKRFPDDGNWYWVRIADWGEARVENPAALSWLNARWTVIERLFQGYGRLRPRIRRFGGDEEPRGLEPWEWSCIGLHRLWDSWNDRDGRILADLRPAVFSFGTEDLPDERTVAYELFYAREGVEAVAVELRGEGTPTGETEEERGEDRSGLVAAVLKELVAREGLTSSDTPLALLSALRSEGLARKVGGRILVAVGGGSEEAVDVATFQRWARDVLDGSSTGSPAGRGSGDREATN
jgi:hypothetical protein